MSNRIMNALAFKVMSLQKNGAGFSNQVMAAARRVIADRGNGTPQDYQTLYKAVGIEKTGGGGMRRAAAEVRSSFSTIGSYAALAGTISQGGLVGAGGTYGLLQTASADVEKLTKNKAFQKLVEKSVMGVVSLLRKGQIYGGFINKDSVTSALGVADTDSGAKWAASTLYGARGLARNAGASLRMMAVYGAAAYFGSKIGVTVGEAITGHGNLGAQRAATNAFNETFSNREATRDERTLAYMKGTSAMHRLRGVGSIPYVGEFFASDKDRMAGFTARDIGRLETTLALRGSMVSSIDPQKLRAKAAERYFSENYGTTIGRVMAMFEAAKVGRPSPETAEGITAKSKELIAAAEGARAKFERAAVNRRFQSAEEYARQANDAVPRSVMVTPERWFRVEESSRVANRMWVLSQSARAGSREWD